MLVEAQDPLILCDRVARTPAGVERLVDLAETLQCGVIDYAGRMNFPSRHPLNQSFNRRLIGQADVILAIEMNDLWGAVKSFSDRILRQSRPATKPGAKIITLGVRDLYLKSNYQDFGRWQDVDLDIAGDGEASLRRVYWKSRLAPEVMTEDVRNLFLFVGADPATGWLRGCGVTLDRGGFVVTGAQSELNQGRGVPQLETSVPGVFAVGDVRAGSVKRVGGAIGEGAQVVAALHGFLGDIAKPAL